MRVLGVRGGHGGGREGRKGEVRGGGRQRGQRGSEKIMGNQKEYPVGENVGREVNDAGLAKKRLWATQRNTQSVMSVREVTTSKGRARTE